MSTTSTRSQSSEQPGYRVVGQSTLRIAEDEASEASFRTVDEPVLMHPYYYVSSPLYRAMQAFSEADYILEPKETLGFFCTRKCDFYLVELLGLASNTKQQEIRKYILPIQPPMSFNDLVNPVDVNNLLQLRYIADTEKNTVDLEFIAALQADPLILDDLLLRYRNPASQEYAEFVAALGQHLSVTEKYYPYRSHPIRVTKFTELTPYIDRRVFDMFMAAKAHIRPKINYDGLLNDPTDFLYVPFMRFCKALYTETHVIETLSSRNNASSVRMVSAIDQQRAWFNIIHLHADESKYFIRR